MQAVQMNVCKIYLSKSGWDFVEKRHGFEREAGSKVRYGACDVCCPEGSRSAFGRHHVGLFGTRRDHIWTKGLNLRVIPE